MRHIAVIAALLLTISCAKSPSSSDESNPPNVAPPAPDPGPGTTPVYEPVGYFSASGLIANRSHHSALPLCDGRVLIGGGDIVDTSDPNATTLRSQLLNSYFQVYDPKTGAVETLSSATDNALTIMNNPIFMEVSKNQILVFPSNITSNGTNKNFLFDHVITLNVNATGAAAGQNPPMTYSFFNVNAFDPTTPGHTLNFGWILGRYNQSLDLGNQNYTLRKTRPDTIKAISSGRSFNVYMPMQGLNMNSELPLTLPNGQLKTYADSSLEFIGTTLGGYVRSANGITATVSGMHLEPDYYSTGFHHIDCIDDGSAQKHAVYQTAYTYPNASDFLNEDYYVNGTNVFVYTLNTSLNNMQESTIPLPIDGTDCSYGWVDSTNVMIFKNNEIVHVDLKARVANLLTKNLPFSCITRSKFAAIQNYGGSILVYNSDGATDANAMHALCMPDGTTYKTSQFGAKLSNYTSTTLPDGKIWIAGGLAKGGALVYTPDSNYFAHIEHPTVSNHWIVGHPSWMHDNMSGLNMGYPVMDDSINDDPTSTDDATLGGRVFGTYFMSEEKYLNANDGAIPLMFFLQGKEVFDSHTDANNAGEITLTIKLNGASEDATSNATFTASLQGRWNLTINDHKAGVMHPVLPWYQSNNGGRISEPVTIVATQSQGPGKNPVVIAVCKTTIKVVR